MQEFVLVPRETEGLEKRAGLGLLFSSISAPSLLALQPQVMGRGCGPGDAVVPPAGAGRDAGGPGGQRALLGPLAKPWWASLLPKLLGRSKEQRGNPPSAGSIPGSRLCRRAAPRCRSLCLVSLWPRAEQVTLRQPGEPAQRGGCKRAGWGGCRELDLLPESNSDVAADLGESLKEGVAEGVDAEGVDSADALDLDQVALDAGHHCPDVAEGDEGKEESPDNCQGDAQDGREQPVAPVLADGEGGVAGFPDAVKAVCSHRLRYHILKIHLGGEKKEVKGVWGSSAQTRIHCNVRGEPEWRGPWWGGQTHCTPRLRTGPGAAAEPPLHAGSTREMLRGSWHCLASARGQRGTQV